MSINNRIKRVIEIKCGGSQKLFAEQIDSTPQYVARLIKDGGSVGIEPVIKILKLYQDINARWLILGGDEQMITEGNLDDIKYFLHQNIKDMLMIEQYLPYMNDEELKQYRDAASKSTAFNYNDKQFERWTKLANNGK